MNKLKKLLLPLTLIIQITAIAFLTRKILLKPNILGKTSSSIFYSQKPITRNPGDPLKHYLKPEANTNQKPFGKWSDKKVTYTINSDTLNERFNYPTKKLENTYRIITLGDSFTFGETVNTKDNYPETLEDLLNQNCSQNHATKYEVINLGVRGHDIEFAVKRLKDRGLKYGPDLVLWLLKDDDFEEIQELRRPISNQLTDEYFKKGDLETLKKVREKISNRYFALYDLEEVLAYNQKALKLIYNYYQKDLLFITPLFASNKYKTMLKTISSQHPNTHLLSMKTPQLYSDNSKNLTSPDGHPNQEGYQEIAENIFFYLTKDQLIPCKPK